MGTAGTARCATVTAELLDWWCGVYGCELCEVAYAEAQVPPPHPGLKVRGPCAEMLCDWSGLFEIDTVGVGEVSGPCPDCGGRIVVCTVDDPW